MKRALQTVRSGLACAAILVSLGVVSTANAALIGRLSATPGGTDYQAYYDDVADLTWAADANINGADNWDNQVAWAAGLNIGGEMGWRLPTTLQPDSSCQYQSGGDSYGYNCTGSELGNLFYNVLGGTAGTSITAHTTATMTCSLTSSPTFTGLVRSTRLVLPSRGSSIPTRAASTSTLRSITTMPGLCIPAMSVQCLYLERCGYWAVV